MAKIYDDFIEMMGEPFYKEAVPEDIIEKYSGLLVGTGDTEDIIIELWNQFGFSGYRNGLFWLVNPEKYNPIAASFEEISDLAIVFARTAMGNLFIWEYIPKLKRPTIIHFNIHTRIVTYKSDSIDFLLNMTIPFKTSLIKEFYGELEYKAVEKFGTIESDECAVFVPALALGGNERIENMELQKIIPHLMILSQL